MDLFGLSYLQWKLLKGKQLLWMTERRGNGVKAATPNSSFIPLEPF